MRWDIFTLFPGMFAGPLSESIIKRAARFIGAPTAYTRVAPEGWCSNCRLIWPATGVLAAPGPVTARPDRPMRGGSAWLPET